MTNEAVAAAVAEKLTDVPRFKVWSCQIVVLGDTELPSGFDSPPRLAAIDAVEQFGINVLGCFSGWGGTLTDEQKEIVVEATLALLELE